MARFERLQTSDRPSILLLDCEPTIGDCLSDRRFLSTIARSGFVDGSRHFPIDSSEVDVVFWDLTACDFGRYFDSDHISREAKARSSKPRTASLVSKIASLDGDRLSLSGKSLRNYLQHIMEHEGYVVAFVGEKNTGTSVAHFLVPEGASTFALNQRYTNTVIHVDEPPALHDYTKRFVQDTAIEVGADAKDVRPGTGAPVLFDRDTNVFAFDYEGRFFLGPRPKRLADAVLFFLTDVLPDVIPNAYPDKDIFPWMSDYVSVREEALGSQLAGLRTRFESDEQALLSEIATVRTEENRLRRLLFADDSEYFPPGESLSDAVAYALADILGFESVVLMDDVYNSRGQPRREDIRVGNHMIVEVKGTERGAKRSWRDDLVKHTLAVCRTEKLLPSDVKSVLVFNHERRLDPAKRSQPFADSADFIAECQESGMLFLPAPSLYFLARAVESGEMAAADARKTLEEASGVLSLNVHGKRETG